MNISTSSNQHISTIIDGECDASHQDASLDALHEAAGREAWDTYHLLGDVLRSNDSAVTFSAGFSERMAARLAGEPTFLGPPATAPSMMPSARRDCTADAGSRALGSRALRRIAVPGALAATVLLAVAVGPRLYEAHEGRLAGALGGTTGVVSMASAARDGEAVLRNPQIDEYLVAHQRFSPSLYSTAQYARPSTFATEASK